MRGLFSFARGAINDGKVYVHFRKLEGDEFINLRILVERIHWIILQAVRKCSNWTGTFHMTNRSRRISLDYPSRQNARFPRLLNWAATTGAFWEGCKTPGQLLWHTSRVRRCNLCWIFNKMVGKRQFFAGCSGEGGERGGGGLKHWKKLETLIGSAMNNIRNYSEKCLQERNFSWITYFLTQTYQGKNYYFYVNAMSIRVLSTTSPLIR